MRWLLRHFYLGTQGLRNGGLDISGRVTEITELAIVKFLVRVRCQTRVGITSLFFLKRRLTLYFNQVLYVGVKTMPLFILQVKIKRTR